MAHKTRRRQSAGKEYVTALVANPAGEIFDLEGYAATGMAGEVITPLTADQMVALPYGGEIMYLPDRAPILLNLATGALEEVRENPWVSGEPLYPVAAFNSPGYVITHNPAFAERADAGMLPLFSYGAVAWCGDGFGSAVYQVDSEDRQDLRCMPEEEVEAGVWHLRNEMPRNRLLVHIKNCALIYGCPAAKNFFLGRYESPLPTARVCNARCVGCISLQENDEIASCQNRIAFTPTPEEIAELALCHIGRVEKAVVSFGQGCEGDPLMAAHVIEPAIRLIREKTDQGTIHMNTNASLPDTLDRLFDAGLDSIRVSLNSVRESVYNAYYRPKNYGFSDVQESMERARAKGCHVAINYLNCPGITDAPEEVAVLSNILKTGVVNQIQWRNLNFDPLRYRLLVENAAPLGEGMGMKALIRHVAKAFPSVAHGYFNPPKERFRME